MINQRYSASVLTTTRLTNTIFFNECGFHARRINSSRTSVRLHAISGGRPVARTRSLKHRLPSLWNYLPDPALFDDAM